MSNALIIRGTTVGQIHATETLQADILDAIAAGPLVVGPSGGTATSVQADVLFNADGNIGRSAAGTLVIGGANVTQLDLGTNNASTTINIGTGTGITDINIGTGAVAPGGEIQLGGANNLVHVMGDLTVEGAEIVNGTSTMNDDVQIGDDPTDTLDIQARVINNIIFQQNANHDIGIAASTAGAGFNLTMYGSAAFAGSAGAGGGAYLQGGAGDGAGVGGHVYLQPGNGGTRGSIIYGPSAVATATAYQIMTASSALATAAGLRFNFAAGSGVWQVKMDSGAQWYDILTSATVSPVDPGTIEYQHLRWDNSGLKWTPETNMTLPKNEGANRTLSVEATSTAGVDGTNLQILSGNPGAGNAGSAADGGDIQLLPTDGSSAVLGVQVGGVGGRLLATSGDGGAGQADRLAGAGGAVQITAGNAGADGGAGGAAGGTVTVTGGNGTGAAAGGSVSLVGGNAAAGAKGSVVVGADAVTRTVYLGGTAIGGTSAAAVIDNTASPVTFTFQKRTILGATSTFEMDWAAGARIVSSLEFSYDAGGRAIFVEDSTGSNPGGALVVRAGKGDSEQVGGAAGLYGGVGGNYSAVAGGTGGAVSVSGGSGGTGVVGGAGGALNLSAGNGGGTAVGIGGKATLSGGTGSSGGDVNVSGGNGLVITGSGGHAKLTAGDTLKDSSGTAGDVYVEPGLHPGTLGATYGRIFWGHAADAAPYLLAQSFGTASPGPVGFRVNAGKMQFRNNGALEVWQDIGAAGAGTVVNPGTILNQILQWNTAGSGSWDPQLDMTLSSNGGGPRTMGVEAVAAGNGAALIVQAGHTTAVGAVAAGDLELRAGTASLGNVGGQVQIWGGDGVTTGGDVLVSSGFNTGAGTRGNLLLQAADSGFIYIGVDTDQVTVRAATTYIGTDGTVPQISVNPSGPTIFMDGLVHFGGDNNATINFDNANCRVVSNITFKNAATRQILVEAAAAASPGDALTLTAGAAVTAGQNGGAISVIGGAGSGAGLGGNANLTGAATAAAGAAGDAAVRGGASTGAGAGGDVRAFGGDATVSTGNGGNVLLRGGTSTGGTAGVVALYNAVQFASPLGAAAQVDFMPGSGSRVVSDIRFSSGTSPRKIDIEVHASAAGATLSLEGGAGAATFVGGNVEINAGAKGAGGANHGYLILGQTNTKTEGVRIGYSPSAGNGAIEVSNTSSPLTVTLGAGGLWTDTGPAGNHRLQIGKTTDTYYSIFANWTPAVTYIPGIRYNSATDRWQIQTDSTIWTNITAGGSVLPGGANNQVLSWAAGSPTWVDNITLPNTVGTLPRTITVDAAAAAGAGVNLTVRAGAPNTAGVGGNLLLRGANGLGGTNAGGFIDLLGGAGPAATSGQAGAVNIQYQASGNLGAVQIAYRDDGATRLPAIKVPGGTGAIELYESLTFRETDAGGGTRTIDITTAGAGEAGDAMNINSGAAGAAGGAGGALNLAAGGGDDGNGGAFTINGGAGSGTGAGGGNVSITGGLGDDLDGGDVTILSGGSASAGAGDVHIDSNATGTPKGNIWLAEADALEVIFGGGTNGVRYTNSTNTLKAVGTGYIDLPHTTGAVPTTNNFKIGGTSVSNNVSAANLGTLTAGPTSNADALHTHAGIGAVALVGDGTITADEIAYIFDNAGTANAKRAIATGATTVKTVGIYLGANLVQTTGLATIKCANAVAVDDELWVSKDTAGQATPTMPSASGEYAVFIGYAKTASAGGGATCTAILQLQRPIAM